MDTTSNESEENEKRQIRKKKKEKRKQRIEETPWKRTNNVVLSSGKFPRLTAMDVRGRTSSFIPSGKGTARLKIGHLPDEIEDLRRWFAGYYRRSV